MDINALLEQMTLEEKCALLSGRGMWHTKGCERLGVPMMMMSDGPHGLRKQEGAGDHLDINQSIPAVAFPAACATGCSFDRELLRELGAALGEACQAENIGVLLGPGVNIKRSPLCGRNFEYFSEDPCLSGELGAAWIQGIQSKHVGASLKHFAMNNQETRRMTVDARADERTMREIYLAPFERAVTQGKPWTVMCSYNKINGVYASENPWLLSALLRDEWGFDGLTVTDWNACNDHVAGVAAGMDLEMPSLNDQSTRALIAAVREGRVEEAAVNRAAARVLACMDKFYSHRDESAVFDRAAQHHLSRRLARECAVLLKNEGGILPLSSLQKVAFIGEFAKVPRYVGGGSSHVNAACVTGALDAVRGVAQVTYAQGYRADSDDSDEALLAKALEAARACDVAVLFVGLPERVESEGFDRPHMRMPDNQLALIDAVCAVNPNTVVVLHNGAPVEMPFADKAAAILEMYLCGDAAGGAAVDLLYGAVSPSGKLAESVPFQAEDNPSFLHFPGRGDSVHYAEGVYVGYRYYDKKKMAVRYPFGFGLSYTRFTYGNLRLSADTLPQGGSLTVWVDVTNTGDVPGKEIVQLYVACAHPGVDRPVRELRGFEKLSLQPGETRTAAFTLTARDFSYWEESIHGWYAEGGAYTVAIGASSRDIRLSAQVDLVPPAPLPVRLSMDSTLGDALAHPAARQVIMPLLEQTLAAFGNQPDQEGQRPMFSQEGILRMIADIPLHALSQYSPLMGAEQLASLLERLNAQP